MKGLCVSMQSEKSRDMYNRILYQYTSSRPSLYQGLTGDIVISANAKSLLINHKPLKKSGEFACRGIAEKGQDNPCPDIYAGAE